ncbi:MAG: prohibitin family protein [Gemmatimonadetes bacterium]|nr:prohibitin family protein [Gemmatimonadota bacterium]
MESMLPMLLAIVVIVAGAVAFVIGPSVAGAENRGKAKLLGVGLMLGGVGLVGINTVVIVDVGEVGVRHFLGQFDEVPLGAGVHIINPLASVEIMSIREQSFPAGGGVETIEAQTSEQMNVRLEVSLLYRIDPARAPDLFARIGSEDLIKQSIVMNAVRNGVRDAVATKSINDIFSPDRAQVANDMRLAIQAKAGDRIEVVEVFLRDVQAPATVREAIDEKLQREQQVAAEKFQTEIIEERALQEIAAARGLAEAQVIITAGLTPEYLMFHYINQLSELPPGSVVYVPTEGGIPLMRSVN